MLSAEDLLTELKNKALPTYGTNQERRDRLKKAFGNIYSNNNLNLGIDNPNNVDLINLPKDILPNIVRFLSFIKEIAIE